MKKLGLEVFDADGNMRPLNDTFNDLNGILSTMTQEEQTKVLSEIFNKVDLKSVNALLANSGERFDELSGYIDNAEGSASQMAETMNSNLAGSVTTMKSALEGAGIAIYQVLEPALKAIVEGITNVLTWFNNLDSGSQTMIVAIGGIVAAIGPLLLLFGSILSVIPQLAAGFALVGGASGILAGALAALPVALGAIAIGVGSSTTALQFLQDKFGTFGYVIGGICEGIYGLFQLTFGNIIIIVSTAAKAIGAILSGNFSQVDDIVREGWAKVENNTAKAMSNIANETSTAMQLISQATEAEMSQVADTFDTALSVLPNLTKHNVGSAAKQFTESLKGMDNEGLTILRGTSDTMAIVLDGITEDMIGTKKGADQMRANLESLAIAGGISANDLEKEISGAMQTINNNLVSESEAMKINATNVFNAFKSVGVNSVADMASNVVAEIKGMDMATVTQLQTMGGTWSTVLNGITTDGSMNATQMKDAVIANFNSMGLDGATIVNQLRSESTAHMNAMAQEADAATQQEASVVEANTAQAKDAAVNNAQEAKEGTKEALDGMADGAESSSEKVKDSLDKNTQAGADAVKENMKQTSQVVMDETGKIPKDVQSNMDKSVQAMRQAGSDIYNGMNTSFSKLASQGKQHFSDLYNGTTRSSSQMADKVIADWNRIKDALSGTITGNVQIKVQGVQEALNQINQVKNATKSYIPNQTNTDALSSAYSMLKSDSMASMVATSNYKAEQLNVNVKADKKEDKKKEGSKVEVNLNIENFVNERKQDVENLIEEIEFITKRKEMIRG